MNNIREQIRTFILTTFMEGADADSLQDDTSLERAHIVDSPENFDTIDAMTSYVERKRAELGL